MTFELNIALYIVRMLPVRLRKPRVKAWLTVWLAPFVWVHAQFLLFEKAARYEIARNGTVASLEKVLNDLFDPVERPSYLIYITDATSAIDRVSLYLIEESQPKLPVFKISEIPPGDYVRLGTTGDYDQQYDFIVWVKLSLGLGSTQIARIRGIVNKYRFAGRRFIIQFY